MMARQYSLNETLQGSRLSVVLDYSGKLLENTIAKIDSKLTFSLHDLFTIFTIEYIPSFFMVKTMILSFSTFLKEFARDCNFDEKAADFPFKVMLSFIKLKRTQIFANKIL